MSTYDNGDWRSECTDIAEMQNEARKEGLFTDIQFSIQTPASKKVFHAHKPILACGSPVFEKMFYGALAEEKNIIELYDDPEIFDLFLNYLYGKTKELTSVTKAYKCYCIGDKYLVSGFKKYAEQCMASLPLDSENFWWIIESNLYSDPFFQSKADYFICDNAYQIFKSAKFKSVPVKAINKILIMNELNASEYELLLSVTEWLYGNLIEISSVCLLTFYQNIRFSNLTREQFCKFIDRFPDALDAQSFLKILMHLSNRSIYQLPDWCSGNKMIRSLTYEVKLIKKQDLKKQKK